MKRSLSACIAAAVWLIGCATEVAHFTPIGANKYAPKPAAFQVEVFTNGVPSRPFERAAILDVHCESQGWLEPNLEKDGLPKLIEQARAAGCDAIIEIETRKPEDWTFETKSMHFTATGIVYK